jgi:ATP-dependent exoDNAse (exonuclease V) alpha subunit
MGDRASAYEDMAARWFDLRSRGGTAVMLATRTRDVDALNEHARSLLLEAERLGRAEVIVGSRRFAASDDVIARRNDYGIGILNGTRASVTAVDPTSGMVHVRTDQDAHVAIPNRYLRDGHLDHGYAMTVHKAQGATFDHALVLADDAIDRERAYTSLSRGRTTNELYVVDAERSRDPHAPEIDPDLRDALAASLKRSSAETMAIDHAQSLEEPGLDLGI